MKSNLDRYRADLDALIAQGNQLVYSMQRDVIGAAKFDAQVKKQLGAEKAEKFLAGLPKFKLTYESWYSESKALIRQLLPDRFDDFVRLHEKPRARKDVGFGNYVLEDYLQGLKVTFSYGDMKVDPSAAIPQFDQMVGILTAAKRRFESSLFDIRQLVQADLFDSEVDAARHLLKQKFARAAGAMVGVVLERHLAQVCANHDVKIAKKNPTIADFNDALKSSDVIDIPIWRGITRLGDLRNLCDHNKEREPTKDEVDDLISGVDRLLKTLF